MSQDTLDVGIEVIDFYSRKKNQYGFLSNFERAPQVVDSIQYPTNEHYYQAMKTPDSKLQQWIRESPTPYVAMKAGRALREHEMTPNWNTRKFEVMLNGLRAKFSQNIDLKEKLLATGNAVLHEDSPTDMVWGKLGLDMLGKQLMQVRSELR